MNVAEKMYEAEAKHALELQEEGWDIYYLQLKGTKGFWEEYEWGALIEMLKPELDWVKPIRANEKFRKYYFIKKKMDELLPLLERSL